MLLCIFKDLPHDVDDIVVQVLVTVLHLSYTNLNSNGNGTLHARKNLLPAVGMKWSGWQLRVYLRGKNGQIGLRMYFILLYSCASVWSNILLISIGSLFIRQSSFRILLP